ncbi:hypothetical protein [Brassicibacter mesophilus]|uniref:hypothetical protein n=1 Tax=Brassicibacter mesophilus TaxID=745119 RepID=UPI003D242F9A
MSKRNRDITQNRIERLIKEGRGQGIGRDYKPCVHSQKSSPTNNKVHLEQIKLT